MESRWVFKLVGSRGFQVGLQAERRKESPRLAEPHKGERKGYRRKEGVPHLGEGLVEEQDANWDKKRNEG